MSRCLRDRTLWRVLEGDASHADRVHVTSCVMCTARLRQLERDMNQLRSVLSGPPPPQAAHARQRRLQVHWRTAAAACAIIIMAVWGAIWWQSSTRPQLLRAAPQLTWPSGVDVAAALMPMTGMAFSTTPEPLSDFDDLQAALIGGWPCEEPAAFGNPACNSEALALLLSGQ
jgi:hypothetical protein